MARREFLGLLIGGSAVVASGDTWAIFPIEQASSALIPAFNSADPLLLFGTFEKGRKGIDEESVAAWQTNCLGAFGRIDKLSLPIMGGRRYGMFLAYMELSACDLYLNVSEDGLVRYAGLGNLDQGFFVGDRDFSD